MKKIYLVICTGIALLAVLVACGSNNNMSSENSISGTNTQESSECNENSQNSNNSENTNGISSEHQPEVVDLPENDPYKRINEEIDLSLGTEILKSVVAGEQVGEFILVNASVTEELVDDNWLLYSYHAQFAGEIEIEGVIVLADFPYILLDGSHASRFPEYAGTMAGLEPHLTTEIEENGISLIIQNRDEVSTYLYSHNLVDAEQDENIYACSILIDNYGFGYRSESMGGSGATIVEIDGTKISK